MVSSAVMGTATVNNVSTAALSRSSNSGKGSDFKSVMASSLAKNTSGANVGSSNNKTGVMDLTKNQNTQVKNDTQSTKVSDKADNKKSDAVSTVDKDKLNDKISDSVQDVKEAIKDELDVSDEDIAKAMEVLGMTVNDLLSVVKVTELVGELTGTDAISLITDDNMLNKLTSILNVVNSSQQDIADMLNIDVNNVSDVISTIKTDDLPAKETVVTDTSDEKGKTEENFAGQPEAVQETLSESLAKKITADGSEKQHAQTGEQNHNTETYGSVADNMLQSVSESFADIITEDTSYVSEADIVNQVIDQIKLTAGKEMTSIEVMLNPERLGSVHVTVSAKNGILSAQIAAQNEQVKTALENQMTALKENFQNQGIKVDAVEITVMTHQFEAGQNFGQNESERKQSERKLNKKLDLSDYMDDPDEDIDSEELRKKASMQNGNSSVEYTA